MSRHWLPCKTELQVGINGLTLDDVTDGTKLVTSRVHVPKRDDGPEEQPLVQPIVHSSTYRINNVQQYKNILEQGGRIYLRLGSPTCEAVEGAINQLEGGAGTVAFGCGMAAISATLLTFLKSGDHVVCCHPLYSGTQDLLVKSLKDRYNVDVTFVGYSIDEYKEAIRPNTKVLFTETPCNPLCSIIDLEEFGKLGKSLKDVVTVVDSTYAPPYIQKPLKYGVDIVVHSATKYLGGHSDLCAGVVTTSTVQQWKELLIARRVYGGVLSPYDASLVLRGLKTLHVRLERQCASAQILADYLEKHDKVLKVFYPGLRSNSGHETAKRQMKMFGAMICFEMKGGLEAARTFVESVRLMNLAVSLGGPETLVEHPATMTHGPMVMSDDDRRQGHITDGMIRLSVGLEDIDDLISDMKQALDKAN